MSKQFKACAGAIVLLAVLSAGYGTSPAHAYTYCDGWSGYYSNNQKIPLAYHYINISTWNGNLDFIGIREDIGGNETFHQWWPGGTTGAQTNTSDGHDRYLRTINQRAGYASSWADESEASELFC
jgi:hypothetical protein